MAAGPAKPPVVLTVDQKQITTLAKALREAEDGKALRKELLRDLRQAASPGIPKLQEAVRSIPAHSLGSPQLRSAVSSEIKVAIRTSGPMSGVRFRVGTNKDPRGFKLAGRRLNNGWRHPLFGHGPWYTIPGRKWFEPTVEKDRDSYRDAILKVMDDMADRIARRAK